MIKTLGNKIDVFNSKFTRKFKPLSSAFLLVLTGCSSLFQDDGAVHATRAVNELRQEIADLKHELRSTQVSFQILEEKYHFQDQAISTMKLKNPKWDQLANQLTVLERKLYQVEKFQESVLADLRALSMHHEEQGGRLNQCERDVAFQKNRLEDVGKLKSTLSSISQAMQNKGSNGSKYTVKSGDTLDKIARHHHVTVTALKKKNHLTSDRIHIGQEIEIPHE